MKVVLSRKGFDSEYGGCPSPIFPDGRMVSLPIPSARASTRYSDLTFGGEIGLGSLVESLTSGRLTASSTTHFDPDLDADAIPRLHGWRPSFGQAGGRLSHLNNCEVHAGDLFLFYGWFNDVVPGPEPDTWLRRRGQHRHVVFGWLQVGEVVDVGSDPSASLAAKPWLKGHPHLAGTWSAQNTVYVAADRLDVPGWTPSRLIPGAGTFKSVSARRVLTKQAQPNRSRWSLPQMFSPRYGNVSLSFHRDTDRWVDDVVSSLTVSLNTVGKGQEFVMTAKDFRPVAEWVSSLFE